MISEEVILAAVVLLVSIIISRIYLFIHRKYLLKLASKTRTTFDEELLDAVKRPIYLGIIMAGICLAVFIVAPETYRPSLRTIFVIIGILWGLFTTVRIVNAYVMWYTAREKLTKSRKTVFLSIKNILDVIVYITTLLLILSVLGIEITPLIASLGIGGLAVALALQSTIANYFSGLYITTDGSIRIGDYIELENGLKGYVEKIGWRCTNMRVLQNNLVIIPNSKLSEMIVTNYHDPTPEMSVIIQCGVAYDSDLEKVEKITVDVAKKVLQKIPGGVKEFNPFIRYHTFGDSNIEFSIILRVKEFKDQYLMKHEFVKELMKAYNKEGIEIAFPCRNVYMRKG